MGLKNLNGALTCLAQKWHFAAFRPTIYRGQKSLGSFNYPSKCGAMNLACKSSAYDSYKNVSVCFDNLQTKGESKRLGSFNKFENMS
jgi:hypothetical protein